MGAARHRGGQCDSSMPVRRLGAIFVWSRFHLRTKVLSRHVCLKSEAAEFTPKFRYISSFLHDFEGVLKYFHI